MKRRTFLKIMTGVGGGWMLGAAMPLPLPAIVAPPTQPARIILPDVAGVVRMRVEDAVPTWSDINAGRVTLGPDFVTEFWTTDLHDRLSEQYAIYFDKDERHLLLNQHLYASGKSTARPAAKSVRAIVVPEPSKRSVRARERRLQAMA